MMRAPAWIVAAWFAVGAGVGAASETCTLGYAGSDQCRPCHAAKYEGWAKTFHATVVQDAKANPSAVKGDFTAPNLGFTLDEVEYTVGGHRDQRYMKKIGDDLYVLPKSWSVQSRAWRPNNVWGWKKMPYSRYCKGCHVTAYDPTCNTTAEPRIGCEACHGEARAHARSGGKAAVVNPRKLPPDRKDMICAACHVRGTDTTGSYSFPVGFHPGDDLGAYYVPDKKQDGETNTEAIKREFDVWRKKREAGLTAKCEVCGIPGVSEPKRSDTDGPNGFCLGCHDFDNKVSAHTRHAPEARLLCLDCHVQQKKDLMNTGEEDVHSYGYFLAHAEQCYDPAIENSCGKCHKDKATDWARDTVETWRRPVPLDH